MNRPIKTPLGLLCAALMAGGCGTSGSAGPNRFPVAQGGHYGYIDASGALAIPYQFEEAHSFRGGAATVAREGKWGFIDEAGAFFVQPMYEAAASFSEGFAAVRQGGRVGFIDRTGAVAIPLNYDGVEAFRDGRALFRIGTKYGFVDRSGREVIPLSLAWASDFSEGLAPASKGGKLAGFIDRSGTIVIPEAYEKVSAFGDGLAAVKRPGDKGLGYIDRSGAVAIPGPFQHASDFHEGRAFVKVEAKYGMIDTSGDWVRRPDGKAAGDLNGGLAAFQPKDGGMIFIDRGGEQAFDGVFDDTTGFDGALAAVRLGMEWAYINRSGQVVWRQRYDAPKAVRDEFAKHVGAKVSKAYYPFMTNTHLVLGELVGVFEGEYVAVCAARAHAGWEVLIPRRLDGIWYWGVFKGRRDQLLRELTQTLEPGYGHLTVVEVDETAEKQLRSSADIIAGARKADAAVVDFLAKHKGFSDAAKVPQIRRYGPPPAGLPKTKSVQKVHEYTPG